MRDTAQNIERLEKIIEETSRTHPHSRDVIRAFSPFLIEKVSLMDTLDIGNDRPVTIDEARFKSGVPLIRQNGFSPAGDACEMIALTVLTPLATGFPRISTDLEKLRASIAEGKIRFTDLFVSPDTEADRLIDTWAVHEDVSPHALGLAASMTARVLLEKRARNWAPLIRDLSWDKGYCPICGSAPMIAKIRDKVGTRHLYCSQCGHDWVFSRVICPSCGCSKQKSMTYFFVDGDSRESAFVCEKCMHYLITVDKVSDLIDFDADVSALSLVHLDVIMQGKGYLPMASCTWNSCL